MAQTNAVKDTVKPITNDTANIWFLFMYAYLFQAVGLQ
ncbi:hypothetical protein GPUN_1309 [Glaciecola punicea ACAM 611]|uniref:Uncharacterized protein n=1 Tax=Glaciecola punicea ACAM 611 TaxID=1121923 RepID=H5TAV6_9ALTE|nr:hypothetical protein GPUN_1309 [Glaciecola punicea ACAM 611]